MEAKERNTESQQARSKQSAAAEENSKTRLLVVEDEPDLRELLEYNLKRDGFEVVSVAQAEMALRQIGDNPPDLILLDLMLPGMDGLELCKAIKADRETKHIPIIMLTAKGEEADIVVGLEMGADDYVTKPFSPRILMARIKAVLRRPESEEEGPDGANRALRFSRLTILPDRHEILIDDQPAELTVSEFRLLHLMAKKPGRVFTRQRIIDLVHEGYAAVTDRSVDVQVVSLRKKLGPLSETIQTVRGVGYRFRED